VDGHVDAVGVVLAGRGAAGARVGPGAADDGHVVGVALGCDLAAGEGDRAGALLVLSAAVGGDADELCAAEALRARGVEDAVADDRRVTGRRRTVARPLGRLSTKCNDCGRRTICRVPVGGAVVCARWSSLAGLLAASARPALAHPAVARATASKAGRNMGSPVGSERDDWEARQRLQALVDELDKAGYTAATKCLADDLDALVVHLRYSTRHRRRWRSTNLLERSLGEVKRRTKVIGRFPSETSCLTLVCAVLDLYITHATNGIKFTRLERQHLTRMR
jgi:mutator family transposase